MRFMKVPFIPSFWKKERREKKDDFHSMGVFFFNQKQTFLCTLGFSIWKTLLILCFLSFLLNASSVFVCLFFEFQRNKLNYQKHQQFTLEAKKDFFKKNKKAAEFLNSCQRLEQGKWVSLFFSFLSSKERLLNFL